MPYFSGYVLVLIEEHVQLTDADPQVPVSELVRNVEPQSPKLASLQCHSVEDAQREEEVLEVLTLPGRR